MKMEIIVFLEGLYKWFIPNILEFDDWISKG